MIIFKNFFSFALTFKAYDWLIANQTHARPIFNVLGSIQLVVCLSSILMCKSGVTGASCVWAWDSWANLHHLFRHLWEETPELLLPP
jgi:hypothetical protein